MRRDPNYAIHDGHRQAATDMVRGLGGVAQAIRTLERWATEDPRYFAVIDVIEERLAAGELEAETVAAA